MKLFKNLFKSSKTDSTESKSIPYSWSAKEKKYTIGWEIYTKDGARLARTFSNIVETERIEYINAVRAEVAEMHLVLNEAANKETEFVNLQGNLFRLNDVTKIVVFNQEAK
jgi:hypothetical protein